MPTRQGIVTLVAGLAALGVGRVFGILELFVIGVAFLVAVGVAVTWVGVRAPRVSARRWVHPSVLNAGETGRVDLDVVHSGAVRSAAFVLEEHIERPQSGETVAELLVEPMRRSSQATAGYDVPSQVRGTIHLGPLDAVWSDPLGLARQRRSVAGLDKIVVTPRTFLLPLPQMGSGALGRHLLAQARRLGPGEFHSLRDYADGDEPRSIHWRASARTEGLLVKQHSVEGLRRALIVFDRDPGSYHDRASFERGIVAAASAVHSTTHGELTTRFVTGGGIDLRGPDTGRTALDLLAELEPEPGPLATLDRDTGDGVGIIILVTGSAGTAGWRSTRSVVDPTMTIVPVTTDQAPRGPLGVGARTEQEFVDGWRTLAGRGRHSRPETAAS